MNKLSMGVFRCSSVSEILKYIRAITSHRAPIKYGVEKVEGKAMTDCARGESEGDRFA